MLIFNKMYVICAKCRHIHMEKMYVVAVDHINSGFSMCGRYVNTNEIGSENKAVSNFVRMDN